MKQNLVKELTKCNIRARAYKRPLDKNLFLITIRPDHPEGTILVNQGRADVTVSGSRKLRQAAVTVRERGRVVTRSCSSRMYDEKGNPTDQQLNRELIRNFPVIMPSNTTWTVKDITVVPAYEKSLFIVKGKVTARVKNSTTNHFLMGMDETHHFIAPLENHADSVRAAHKMLRPKHLSKKTRRQGEWFFVPCTRTESQRLNILIAERHTEIRVRRLDNTTHVAKSAVQLRRKPPQSSVIYARGYICDDRQGHHRSLFLPTWHKVVKNKEGIMRVSPEQREAAARRRNTFD